MSFCRKSVEFFAKEALKGGKGVWVSLLLTSLGDMLLASKC